MSGEDHLDDTFRSIQN